MRPADRDTVLKPRFLCLPELLVDLEGSSLYGGNSGRQGQFLPELGKGFLPERDFCGREFPLEREVSYGGSVNALDSCTRGTRPCPAL